jgi:hypothetical protein
MGLPEPGQEYIGGGPRFADDVLNIELYGPDKPLFSVVDVPGLFQSMFELCFLFSFGTYPNNCFNRCYYLSNRRRRGGG